MEANSGPAFHICPHHLGIEIEVVLRFRQSELQPWLCSLGQSVAQHQSNSAFADVGSGCAHRLISEQYIHQHFDWLPEIAAPLPDHEIQRRMKTPRGVENAD